MLHHCLLNCAPPCRRCAMPDLSHLQEVSDTSLVFIHISFSVFCYRCVSCFYSNLIALWLHFDTFASFVRLHLRDHSLVHATSPLPFDALLVPIAACELHISLLDLCTDVSCVLFGCEIQRHCANCNSISIYILYHGVTWLFDLPRRYFIRTSSRLQVVSNAFFAYMMFPLLRYDRKVYKTYGGFIGVSFRKLLLVSSRLRCTSLSYFFA